jgi:hypothetical protein
MLQFNPAKRISVDDALRHPFLASQFSEDQLLEAQCAKPMSLEIESIGEDPDHLFDNVTDRILFCIEQPLMLYSNRLLRRCCCTRLNVPLPTPAACHKFRRRNQDCRNAYQLMAEYMKTSTKVLRSRKLRSMYCQHCTLFFVLIEFLDAFIVRSL